MTTTENGKALTKRGKYRLTLDLSPDFYDRLKDLEELVDVENQSRLIREALKLYEYVVRSHSQGARFIVRTQDGREETLLLLGLQA